MKPSQKVTSSQDDANRTLGHVHLFHLSERHGTVPCRSATRRRQRRHDLRQGRARRGRLVGGVPGNQEGFLLGGAVTVEGLPRVQGAVQGEGFQMTQAQSLRLSIGGSQELWVGEVGRALQDLLVFVLQISVNAGSTMATHSWVREFMNACV